MHSPEASASTATPLQVAQQVCSAKRIVVKLGSQPLLDDQGFLAIDRLAALVRSLAQLQRLGRQVVLVSSGATALGRQHLQHRPLPNAFGVQALNARVCAAIGQTQLVETYRHLFAHYGVTVGQVLLNPSDFSDRQRYRAAQFTLHAMLDAGVIPILNENDVLCDPPTPEAFGQPQANSFGDNDHLAALIAFMLEADALLMLSSVAGVYMANPQEHPDAQALPFIADVKRWLDAIDTQGKTGAGRGGMRSKLKAVITATNCGIPVGLYHAAEAGRLATMLQDSATLLATAGTLFAGSSEASATAYRKWIGLSSGYHGVVRVNEGAKRALLDKGASLLPVGITQVMGEFKRGHVVSVQDELGQELGRGVVGFDSDELTLLAGKPTHQWRTPDHPLKHSHPGDEAIHRDHLFLY
jgi:glutamate 5-kinase